MRIVLAALPLMFLAACGDGNDAAVDANSMSQAAPVAAATPPAGKKWEEMVQKTADNGYRIGNPDAPVKLVEYGSRTCSHCGDFGKAALEPMRAQFISTGKVSYEYRDYLRNGADLAATLLGECGGPDTFFPILEQMFIQQEAMLKNAPGENDPFYKRLEGAAPAQQPLIWAEGFGYLDFVKQRGIPEAKARACLADGKAVDSIVKSNEAATKQYNIQGTPTFILNGQVLQNTVTWEQVQTALKRAGA